MGGNGASVFLVLRLKLQYQRWIALILNRWARCQNSWWTATPQRYIGSKVTILNIRMFAKLPLVNTGWWMEIPNNRQYTSDNSHAIYLVLIRKGFAKICSPFTWESNVSWEIVERQMCVVLEVRKSSLQMVTGKLSYLWSCFSSIFSDLTFVLIKKCLGHCASQNSSAEKEKAFYPSNSLTDNFRI